MGELSSVENTFWVNHETKKAPNNLKGKIFGWIELSEKMSRLYSGVLENNWRNRSKISIRNWNRPKIAAFRILINETPIETNCITCILKLNFEAN